MSTTPHSSEPTGHPGGLRSVGISTAVLDCFAEHEELGPTQVARELGVAKSTAFSMLAALAAGGLLDRTTGGRYRLSLRLFDYGQLVLDRLPVRRLARPELLALHETVGEMVQLGLPANGYVVYAERFGDDALGPQISGEWMRKVGGYASSAGRAMAAFDSAVARATFAVPMVRHTARTVTDPAQVHRILAGCRSRGWVRSVEESAPGYTSIAAPVFDGRGKVAAAVSVVGSTSRLTSTRGQFVARSLVVSARRVSQLLAAHGDQ